MKAKGELVKAAKKLMWERGYEATSPRDLLEESGAGQGSLYHHFKGKMDLASVALGEVSDEMCELARETVGTDGSALDRVIRYLDASRDGLKGCRMGRFAAESSIAEASLRKPVERYFRELQEILAGALREAQRAASSFRGFIAIGTPSIGPRRWPSRCSSRCHAARQGEAVFDADIRGVRPVSAEVLACGSPGKRPAIPPWSWRQIIGLCLRIVSFELKKAPGSRKRSRQVWEKHLRAMPPFPVKSDRSRRG